MDTAVPLNVIVDNLVEMNDLFTDVAMGDGAAPLLVAMGGLIVVASLGIFGALTLGAVGNLFTAN
ncbi:hypothetical protein [Halostagnicola kamekurae]|uniref:Uncharacterized protein n=1 Tax=Halostagnicola kamekurae TaxID=619731 RepID=A0A1I6RH33_9EURY|nr:hypothetical protein [Halostagnicola kamekurae]SFS64041.1 hypothetical protein SAMN04488556_1792 [Halostagnicola kamekurae]